MEHSILAGDSILLVEPSPHMASDLARALDGAGAEVFIASTLVEALPLVESVKLSGAVLDYTQSIGERVVTRLSELGVPFLFCKDIRRNEAWPHAPVLNRPISNAEIVDLLRRLLDPQTGTAAEQSEHAAGPQVGAEQRAVRSLP